MLNYARVWFCLNLNLILILSSLSWIVPFGPVSVGYCQDELVLAQSRNPSFEAGLDGWEYSTVTSELITRNFTAVGANRWESFAPLGSKLVRLRGNGVWGQSIVHGTLDRFHLLSAFVCKRATSGSGPAGYAEIGLTYYDINGNVLQNIPIEVPDADPTLNRGVGDGLVLRSWGVKAPPGAYRTFLYAYTTQGTDLYLDSFGLYQLSNTVRSPYITKNLLMNSLFAEVRPVSEGGVWVGYGPEFWETDLDWSDGFEKLFGSPTQEEVAYQFVNVTSGAAYSLFAEGNKIPEANWPAAIGVDFFDANWKQVGQSTIDLYGVSGQYNRGKRVVAPATAVRASIWIWCDVGSASSSLTVYPRFFMQESTAGSATSVIATDASVSTSKSGSQGSITVVYSDPDGMNTSTIDVKDGFFKSKANTSLTYPIAATATTTFDDGKVVVVKYIVATTNFADVGEFTINANQVKDKKGNSVATKSFLFLNLR